MPSNSGGLLWDWYQSLPWLTRVYWLLLLITVVFVQLGVVTGRHVCHSWGRIWRGQIYRIGTSMFHTGSGMDALFHLRTFLVVSSTLEKNSGYVCFVKELVLSAVIISTGIFFLIDHEMCAPLAPVLLTSLMMLFSWSGYPLPPLSIFGMLVIQGDQLVYYHLALVIILGGNLELVMLGLGAGAISHYVSKYFHWRVLNATQPPDPPVQ